MKNRIFVIVFILIFLGVSLSATQKHEAIINKITPDHLLAYKYPDDAKENFAIFEDKIQITGKDITISAAWVGHSITASNENVITFSLQSLDNSTPEVKSYISFYAYHADSSDQCAGSADKKTFKMKRIFNFKIRANSDLKNIKIPLKISDNDLKCEQCGRVLKHGNFLFYFELVDKGKITISPFELQTSFPVRIQSKTDEHAEYLSNIVQDDYTPYPMKELPKQAVFSEDFGTLSQKLMATRKDFSEFQVVLNLYQKGNYVEAVHLAKSLKENVFASTFLYLIYSRGYNGIEIDNKQAGKYFSQLFGSYFGREPGFMLYIFDYQNVWKKYRLTPTCPDEKLTITAWGPDSMPMQEIIPLRGKYLLRDCYEEKMQNIGGVGARTLYLIAREQVALNEVMQEAQKLNSAEALVGLEYAPFEQRGMQPERTPLEKEGIIQLDKTTFTNLEKAAELGYVPAKLIVARALVTPNFKEADFNAGKARKLLQETIEECSKYKKIGCSHALTDLRYAQDLLAIIPDKDTSSDKLNRMYDDLQKQKAKSFDHNFINFRLSIIENMLKNRSDNPESLFFQAEKIPNHEWQKKQQAMLKAMEAGSKQATFYCLAHIRDKNYYKVLIWAGKHKIPYNGNYNDFFNEAYMKIRELKYQSPPDEYKKMLENLAPYHKEAKNELSQLTDNEKLAFEFISDDNLTTKCQFLPNDGRPMIKISAEPSEIERHIIIKRGGAKKLRGGIFFHTTSQERSNLHLYCEFVNEREQTIKTYAGNNPPMAFIPTELKITIAPRKTPLDLQINIMVYR